MKDTIFTVIGNRRIAKDTYEMLLEGDVSGITGAGTFVNIALSGRFLRRPISVCDVKGDVLTIIYKCVGSGTEMMAGMPEGTKLDVLTGLGNGYDLTKSGERPLLIGGGAGVPPMYMLAKKLIGEGKKPQVILGFNTSDEIFYADEFTALGCEVTVTTADGSVGIRGFVTDAMKTAEYTYFYACGPMPMFRAIEKTAVTSGQYSFEERMGCGFGACMGCSMKTNSGARRICREGPVFEREDIIW